MAEVIGILIVFALYVFLVYLFFAYLFVPLVVIGSVVAGVWSLVSLGKSIVEAAGGRYPSADASKPTGDVPAYRPYFFKRAFLDVYYIVGATVMRNWHWLVIQPWNWLLNNIIRPSTGEEEGGLAVTWVLIPIAVAVTVLGFSFGMLATLLFAGLFGLVTFLFICLAWVVMAAAGVMELVLALFRTVKCPNPECRATVYHPVYLCWNCRREHKFLVPSIYGIFRRKCACEAILPTSFLWGREGLASLCPYCRRELPAHGKRARHPSYVVSGVWFLFALDVALFSPRLAYVSGWIAEPIHLLMPLVTMGLILANFIVCIRYWYESGRTLTALPIGAMQLLLFTLLFFQMCMHWGADLYHFSGRPTLLDWVWFSIAHAVHASDVPDVLQAYDWNIQAIHQRSTIVGLWLVIYHFIVDLFLISAAVDLVDWFIQRRARLDWKSGEQFVVDLDEWKRIIQYGSAIVVGVSLLATIIIAGWRPVDAVLWLVDNVLKTIDFADVMHVYHVRLYEAPQDIWIKTLTFVSRTILSAFFLYHILKRVTDWKKWLLRDLVAEKVGVIQRIAGWFEAHPVLAQILAPFAPVAAVILLILLVIPFPVHGIATHAMHDPLEAASSYLAQLHRLGPMAEGAVPLFEQEWPKLDRQRRSAILAVCGSIGESASPFLLRIAKESPDVDMALRAFTALAQMWPAGNEELIEGLRSRHYRVRQGVREFLQQLGSRDARYVAEAIRPWNVAKVLPILERIDKYWFTLRVKNPCFDGVLEAYTLETQVLDDPDCDIAYLSSAIDRLGELKMLAIRARPKLERLRDSHPDTWIRTRAAESLRQIAADEQLVTASQ